MATALKTTALKFIPPVVNEEARTKYQYELKTTKMDYINYFLKPEHDKLEDHLGELLGLQRLVIIRPALDKNSSTEYQELCEDIISRIEARKGQLEERLKNFAGQHYSFNKHHSYLLVSDDDDDDGFITLF